MLFRRSCRCEVVPGPRAPRGLYFLPSVLFLKNTYSRAQCSSNYVSDPWHCYFDILQVPFIKVNCPAVVTWRPQLTRLQPDFKLNEVLWRCMLRCLKSSNRLKCFFVYISFYNFLSFIIIIIIIHKLSLFYYYYTIDIIIILLLLSCWYFFSININSL